MGTYLYIYCIGVSCIMYVRRYDTERVTKIADEKPKRKKGQKNKTCILPKNIFIFKKKKRK